MIKKEKFKLVCPPLFFAMDVPCTNYNKSILKKEQTILKREKYNHKCTKEINLMPSRRFSDISKFHIFCVKNEKKLTI